MFGLRYHCHIPFNSKKTILVSFRLSSVQINTETKDETVLIKQVKEPHLYSNM